MIREKHATTGEQIIVTGGIYQTTINLYPECGHLVPGDPGLPLVTDLGINLSAFFGR